MHILISCKNKENLFCLHQLGSGEDVCLTSMFVFSNIKTQFFICLEPWAAVHRFLFTSYFQTLLKAHFSGLHMCS